MNLYRRIRRGASIVVVGVVSACSGTTEPKPATPPTTLTQLPRELTVGERQVLRAGNEFSLALFRQLAKVQPNKNVFMSPLSASMALGMTMNGARGTTLDAMRTTLGVGTADLQQINAGYKGLIDLLRGLDPSTTFQLANAIWYRNEFPVRQEFIDAVKAAFNAEVRGLNFNDLNSLSVINGWVSSNTQGKIPKILEFISPDDQMYLMNAIYFKASWRTRFDPALTRPGTFRASGGTTQTVNMMRRDPMPGVLNRVFSMPHLYTAELGYGNDAFAMTILLPERGANVDSVAAALTTDKWNEITAMLDGSAGTVLGVTLPKFSLTYERTLNEDLAALGMGIAFGGGADFSGLSPASVSISYVKQKAFVDVNEAGTEAAAVTNVAIAASTPPSLDIDRPFIFVIRDRLSGTILFMGKMNSIP
ncbi:MAG TPA: serpin family protein [Gemmatimonadaceae bacterium]